MSFIVLQLIIETKVSIIGKYKTDRNKFIMTFNPHTNQLFSIFFLFNLRPTKNSSITAKANIPMQQYNTTMSVEKFVGYGEKRKDLKLNIFVREKLMYSVGGHIVFPYIPHPLTKQ